MSFEDILEIKFKKGELSKHMAKIPSLIYQYGLEDNELHDRLDTVKEKLNLIEATVKSGLRLKYKRSKVSLTEKELNELVLVSEEYEEIKEYNKKIRKLNKLIRLSKLRLQSLRDKRDMLINIAHNERLEKSTKIR